MPGRLVRGDRQDPRLPVAVRDDAEEAGQAVATDEERRRPGPAEPVMHGVGEPDRQARLPQVGKQRLAGRIRVRADDDPEDLMKVGVHPSPNVARETEIQANLTE